MSLLVGDNGLGVGLMAARDAACFDDTLAVADAIRRMEAALDKAHARHEWGRRTLREDSEARVEVPEHVVAAIRNKRMPRVQRRDKGASMNRWVQALPPEAVEWADAQPACAYLYSPQRTGAGRGGCPLMHVFVMPLGVAEGTKAAQRRVDGQVLFALEQAEYAPDAHWIVPDDPEPPCQAHDGFFACAGPLEESAGEAHVEGNTST